MEHPSQPQTRCLSHQKAIEGPVNLYFLGSPDCRCKNMQIQMAGHYRYLTVSALQVVCSWQEEWSHGPGHASPGLHSGHERVNDVQVKFGVQGATVIHP